jgi:CRP/FNR family transcriptional regulator
MKTTASELRCATCPVRHTTEWASLTNEEADVLDKGKVDRSYLPGDVIYNQGDMSDGLYAVHSGMIGLRRYESDGSSLLLHLVRNGTVFGYRSYLSKTEHSVTAEVLMPGKICFIQSRTVQVLLQQNPNVGLGFLEHSLANTKDMEAKYARATVLTVKSRVLHFLLTLYEQYGSKTEDGEHILDLPFNRQDLASAVGTTPETLSRTVRLIEEDGLVVFHGKQIRIPDLQPILDTVPVIL